MPPKKDTTAKVLYWTAEINPAPQLPKVSERVLQLGTLPQRSLQAQGMGHAAAKKHDKITNWAQYNASLKARDSLTIWLNKRMRWFAAASGKHCSQPKFSELRFNFV